MKQILKNRSSKSTVPYKKIYRDKIFTSIEPLENKQDAECHVYEKQPLRIQENGIKSLKKY